MYVLRNVELKIQLSAFFGKNGNQNGRTSDSNGKAMLRVSGGYLKGHQISVRSKALKPTLEIVRQSVFNLIEVRDVAFLDLFAGSGIVGIEAISRGASFVCFIDKDTSLVKQLRENLKLLRIEPPKYRIICEHWISGIKLLEKEEKKFNVIFADPFYDFDEYYKLMKTLTALLHGNGVVILEHSARVSIEVPEEFRIISSKVYGETRVEVIKLL